jgi:hypothetical protein
VSVYVEFGRLPTEPELSLGASHSGMPVVLISAELIPRRSAD